MNSSYCISLIFIFSISISSIMEIYAQEESVKVSAIGFEEAAIITFENTGDVNIETVRMWPSGNFTFESFKTENGWEGKITSVGVVVFTGIDAIKPGEFVKFGLKADKPNPGINWKILDIDDQVIKTSSIVISEKPETVVDVTVEGVSDESTFRLIPKKPNVGSDIRVVGQNFGINQPLELFLGDDKLKSFETNEKGSFIITTKIPNVLSDGRIDFTIKDVNQNESGLSLRIGESTDRMASVEIIPLTIGTTPPIIYRGGIIDISGTGKPNTTITITTTDENEQVIFDVAIEIDVKGNWNYKGTVAPDAELGKRTAIITDGKDKILRTFDVASSKIIDILPVNETYDPGQTIEFSGTVNPEIDLVIIIEDPQGSEIYADVLTVDESGEVFFEFKTEQFFDEGTYVLIASQGTDTELTLVGLGEAPEIKLLVRMDALNYGSGVNATVNFQGPPSSTISLLIIDPSDQKKAEESLILGPDGTTNYELDLRGYTSGVYTLVANRGTVQFEEVFSVGLQTGSGPIEILTTKETYQQGEPILVLGNSGANILLEIFLVDIDGNEVKSKQTFTNKEGIFSEGSLKIPIDATPGLWTIIAKSGSNFDSTTISVIPDASKGISVSLESIEPTVQGKLVTFKGFGARPGTVNIYIESTAGNTLEEQAVLATGNGEFQVQWIIPSEIPTGEFVIRADDSLNEVSLTFTLQ